MSPFLRNVMQLRLEEHERNLSAARFKNLPKGPCKRTLEPDIEAPTQWQVDMSTRRASARRMRASGLTFAEIAAELKITERQARTAIHSDGREYTPRQPKRERLFPLSKPQRDALTSLLGGPLPIVQHSRPGVVAGTVVSALARRGLVERDNHVARLTEAGRKAVS